MSCPARQARHSPQVGVGCRITVSPTATFVTAEPTSCTQPAFSWPMRVGQRRVHRLRPLAQDDVQVGTADACSADLDHHVERTLDGRLRHLLDDGLLVVACNRTAFIGPPPSRLGREFAYRCCNMPRHTLPFASMLTRVSRARRRCSGSACDADRLAGDGVDEQRRVVAPPADPARLAARAAVPIGGGRHVAERELGELVDGRARLPAAAGRPGRSRPARPCGRSRSGVRPALPPARPSKDSTNPARAATPRLISSEAKWSSSTTSVVPHARHAADRIVGVGHHQEGEVGRAEVRRQPQPDAARPRPRTRCTT